MTHSQFTYWKKLNPEQIRIRVREALKDNVDFEDNELIGVPASHLDPKVFYSNAPILKDAPFLSSLVKNPNHIGCHTLGDSEPFFRGTQEIERELIEICASDILGARPGTSDGYVASGGTEANIQAIWIYRNFFIRELGAVHDEIVILTSSDAHYSMFKAADLLNLSIETVGVSGDSREITSSSLDSALESIKKQGKKYVIVVANMMTTMFGSVDDPDTYASGLQAAGLPFKIHVDGAYGGFLYPFMCDENALSFTNPHISSVTLDAHKLVQAPYGTGIFLARKGLMKYVLNDQAQYIKGLDATLSGSRSGANAVAVWMILSTYGPHGWYEKNQMLMLRTSWLCERLDELEVPYYRNPRANIITLRTSDAVRSLVDRFGLVPDSHGTEASWFKIVVMDHVTLDKLATFLEELKKALGK